jgi:hypothetical protein
MLLKSLTPVVSLQHSWNSVWVGGFVSSLSLGPQHVHVTFEVSLPPPIHFSTRDTLRDSSTGLEKSESVSGIKDFLSHYILTRIVTCTVKKRGFYSGLVMLIEILDTL